MTALFICLAIIAVATIADCESDAAHYARRVRRRKRAFRRELKRMRGAA